MFNSLEEFVDIMERLKIEITDPITGHEEDWYLINIGDIKPDTNIDNIKLMSANLTKEFKEREKERISELIKEKFPKRLVKAPKKV